MSYKSLHKTCAYFSVFPE